MQTVGQERPVPTLTHDTLQIDYLYMLFIGYLLNEGCDLPSYAALVDGILIFQETTKWGE